jgi:hypothetical protein
VYDTTLHRIFERERARRFENPPYWLIEKRKKRRAAPNVPRSFIKGAKQLIQDTPILDKLYYFLSSLPNVAKVKISFKDFPSSAATYSINRKGLFVFDIVWGLSAGSTVPLEEAIAELFEDYPQMISDETMVSSIASKFERRRYKVSRLERRIKSLVHEFCHCLFYYADKVMQLILFQSGELEDHLYLKPIGVKRWSKRRHLMNIPKEYLLFCAELVEFKSLMFDWWDGVLEGTVQPLSRYGDYWLGLFHEYPDEYQDAFKISKMAIEDTMDIMTTFFMYPEDSWLFNRKMQRRNVPKDFREDVLSFLNLIYRFIDDVYERGGILR